MRGYGIIVTRLVVIAALVITLLGGQYLQDHPGIVTGLAIGLLLLITVSAMLIPPGATESAVTPPRWAEITCMVAFTLAGGALCVLVPDGTAVALPFIAAWFTPRVGVSRRFEIGLLIVDVAALWTFSLIVAGPWWTYPVVLAGVLAAYQAGLRSRERVERAELAELMLAREQALRSERERAAAAAERERIARDLHDVLAHTLSGLAITLQNASTLLHSGASDRAQVQVDRARALAVEGQAEARQALAALAPGVAPAPVDISAAIDRAVRDHRALTGSAVTLSIGQLPDVPADVTSAALAVLRESLTNVIRHAPDAPVSVSARITQAPGPGPELVLRVADDPGAPAPADGGGGLGVAGMRARVDAVGGSLRAGPTPTGWAVELTVPIIPNTTAVQPPNRAR